MPDDSPTEAPKSGSLALTLIACAVLLLGAGAAYWLIVSTQPEAERTTQTRQTAMLVEAVPAERGDYRPRIVALGSVVAAREIQLSPRVSGQVIERAPSFTPGGFLKAGEVLLRIDPADFRNTLEQRKSELRQASADLDLEMGRQEIAQSDFELLEDDLLVENPGLVLRKPQLNTAQARLESAQAAVAQAELDLERTTIVAPFDVQVMERSVDVGSQVAPGDNLGRLVGVDQFWVTTTVQLSSLPWIEVGDRKDGTGSPATVRHRSAWPAGETRLGQVERLIGTLNEDTRLARLLVTVDDPLALESENAGQPPLILGSVLEVVITGREITDVVRINRAHLRANDTVWIIDDAGELRIAEVEVVFEDAVHAYLGSGVEEGERVVTTNLSTVTEGAPLRLEGDDE